MSIKLAFLLLVGLIVLAGALPAENDEAEDSATDLQDPAETSDGKMLFIVYFVSVLDVVFYVVSLMFLLIIERFSYI